MFLCLIVKNMLTNLYKINTKIFVYGSAIGRVTSIYGRNSALYFETRNILNCETLYVLIWYIGLLSSSFRLCTSVKTVGNTKV